MPIHTLKSCQFSCVRSEMFLVVALLIVVLTSGTVTDLWSAVALVVAFVAFLLVNIPELFRYKARRVRMIESAAFALFVALLIASLPASYWPMDTIVGLSGVLAVSDVVRRWRAEQK